MGPSVILASATRLAPGISLPVSPGVRAWTSESLQPGFELQIMESVSLRL